MWFLHVKFIADFRTMLMACSGCQFGLCRRFTYRTIILPTPGHSGTTLGLPSILEALATTSHPPAEFPFWVTPSICTAPPWVTHSNKSSHRHAICWGVVGLAWALGGFC